MESWHIQKIFDKNAQTGGIDPEYERKHTMSPGISLYVYFVGPLLAFIGIFLWTVNDLFRPKAKRSYRTNVVIAAMASVGVILTYSLNSNDSHITSSFTQANTAVLATVKKGDLVLCTDPASGRVMQAMLVRSVVSDAHTTYNKIHGHFLDQEVFRETDSGIYPSYFNRCQVEAFRDDGLSSIDQKIGKIIRSGLNPPSPPK